MKLTLMIARNNCQKPATMTNHQRLPPTTTTVGPTNSSQHTSRDRPTPEQNIRLNRGHDKPIWDKPLQCMTHKLGTNFETNLLELWVKRFLFQRTVFDKKTELRPSLEMLNTVAA